MKETQKSKFDAHVLVCTTADHDRQGQGVHRQYKLRTVVEVTSDKGHACINDNHKHQRLKLITSVWSLVLAALIREMAAICQRI